jgi:hypothetical protein
MDKKVIFASLPWMLHVSPPNLFFFSDICWNLQIMKRLII